MKITDGAKKFIQETLDEEKADAIRLRTSNSCCGRSLQFELVKLTGQEQPEMINGLSILMDQETRAWTNTITLGARGNRLTLTDSAASCCG
jgi:Fe-S cluster assembly iron-binding protein IscA